METSSEDYKRLARNRFQKCERVVSNRQLTDFLLVRFSQLSVYLLEEYDVRVIDTFKDSVHSCEQNMILLGFDHTYPINLVPGIIRSLDGMIIHLDEEPSRNYIVSIIPFLETMVISPEYSSWNRDEIDVDATVYPTYSDSTIGIPSKDSELYTEHVNRYVIRLLEGIPVRVYFTGARWLISTNTRLDAFRSRKSTLTIGETFEIITGLSLNGNSLKKETVTSNCTDETSDNIIDPINDGSIKTGDSVSAIQASTLTSVSTSDNNVQTTQYNYILYLPDYCVFTKHANPTLYNITEQEVLPGTVWPEYADSRSDRFTVLGFSIDDTTIMNYVYPSDLSLIDVRGEEPHMRMRYFELYNRFIRFNDCYISGDQLLRIMYPATEFGTVFDFDQYDQEIKDVVLYLRDLYNIMFHSRLDKNNYNIGEEERDILYRINILRRDLNPEIHAKENLADTIRMYIDNILTAKETNRLVKRLKMIEKSAAHKRLIA